MNTTIYHNPRCSKSRKTLALLEQRGIEPTIVEYLLTPPSADTLRAILSKLGLSPRELIRRKESVYSELQLDDQSVDDDALIKAMVDNPILIERPIVIVGDKAVIGRPPENIEALF